MQFTVRVTIEPNSRHVKVVELPSNSRDEVLYATESDHRSNNLIDADVVAFRIAEVMNAHHRDALWRVADVEAVND